MRRIRGLKWAKQLHEWPDSIPRPRPRGVKAYGRRYESLVAKALGPDAIHGAWWEYKDANGPGLCQTDFLIVGAMALVLECKHTWTLEGIEQLQDLYLPVVAMALGKRTIGVQVCKNLVAWAEGPRGETLSEAVVMARITGLPTTVHWRGVLPLLTKELTYHG
jgi:hypothetical protein